MSQFLNLFCTFLLFIYLPTLPSLPLIPDPVEAPLQTQKFLPPPSPPATIPAFPEQSNFDGCQLDLPDELFSGVKSACGNGHHKFDSGSYSGQVHRTRCCPVLAAWLYAAYSRTALERAITSNKAHKTASSNEVDMPLLPDDSETCVDTLEKALVNKGVKLTQPNETCDAVYCYCGIRLHPLSCPEAFYVNSHGKLAGGQSVKKLEQDCSSNNANGYSGLGGCSKCLKSLYSLNDLGAGNTSKSEDRASKMRSRDCELMGLTWLLNKNRTAYIRTVSSVLRALMMSPDGTDPLSCTLSSDGMPLAVDSSEINDQSSSSSSSRLVDLQISFCLYCCILLPIALLYIGFVV
ncbi:hypothetical protein M9H77_29055 [Catharanthus roseus]|uniref:Uncharacterized protein n=1 Tax=Catharanthus roseus TaxID=4058 RepID=A0ACC0AIJ0_CATRO|nr:hypothetical protein M9H77_29055 [Catharanthus roseus]